MNPVLIDNLITKYTAGIQAAIGAYIKSIGLKFVNFGCVSCTFACGLGIIWFAMDTESPTAKKIIFGSYIVYLGFKLVAFILL